MSKCFLTRIPLWKICDSDVRENEKSFGQFGNRPKPFPWSWPQIVILHLDLGQNFENLHYFNQFLDFEHHCSKGRFSLFFSFLNMIVEIVFLNFQNFNRCLKGHESLGVGSLSLSFCWTGNVHHSDNIPQRSLKVFSKWICLCHCAYIRVFLCWSSDISPLFRFEWPLSLLFQYFFHVPRLIFKNKTRPNWARKVREMILFSVL